jgi:hypothetical protein
MPQVKSSLTPILLNTVIFEILANFDSIVMGEGVEIAKKPEDMSKRIVLAF